MIINHSNSDHFHCHRDEDEDEDEDGDDDARASERYCLWGALIMAFCSQNPGILQDFHVQSLWRPVPVWVYLMVWWGYRDTSKYCNIFLRKMMLNPGVRLRSRAHLWREHPGTQRDATGQNARVRAGDLERGSRIGAIPKTSQNPWICLNLLHPVSWLVSDIVLYYLHLSSLC